MTSSYADHIAEQIRLAICGGYDSPEQIIEDLTELVENDEDAEDYADSLAAPIEEHLRALVDEALTAHAESEASYPDITDCDRLDAVFAQLHAAGIVARQDVGFTSSDVRDEMWASIDDERSRGSAVRGWVAFHRQDVDRVIDTGTLFLAYAAATDLDDDFRVIAAEVAQAFREAGFEVEWDGDPARRIELRGVAWHKRRRMR